MPNVSSHITIKITKSSHHFCFTWIYFFLQTIKYTVTGRRKCTDAKYLILFGAQKALIMQLAPKVFLDSKRQPLTIVMGPGHVGEIPWASFIIRFRFVSQRCVCSLPPSPGTALHIIKSSPQTDKRHVLSASCYHEPLPLFYAKPSFAAFSPPYCCWHQEYTSCLLSGRIYA